MSKYQYMSSDISLIQIQKISINIFKINIVSDSDRGGGGRIMTVVVVVVDGDEIMWMFFKIKNQIHNFFLLVLKMNGNLIWNWVKINFSFIFVNHILYWKLCFVLHLSRS